MASPSPPEAFSSKPPPPGGGLGHVRFSGAVRFVFGVAFVTVLALGAWLVIQFFVSTPAAVPILPPQYLTAAPEESSDPGDSVPLSEKTQVADAYGAVSVAADRESLSSEIVASSNNAPEDHSTDSTRISELLEQIRSTENPLPMDFLKLAEAYSEQGDFDEAGRWLEKGLASAPGNDELFLALADVARVRDGAEAAWHQLARTGRGDDIRFVRRLLKYGLASGRSDETLVVLASVGTAMTGFSEDDWSLVARLYEASGNIDRAIELVDRHLRDRSELFRLRSLQQKEAGNLAEAIFNQEQYVARLEEPGAGEWRNLANLYEAGGRPEEAARARDQAARADEGPPRPGASSPAP